MSSQIQLLGQRRYAPFFLTQLAGAFNDNLFKQVLVLLVTFHTAVYSSADPALLTNIAAGLFILPFVFFSAFGGQLADKYDKSRVIQILKFAEVLIMALAAVGLYQQNLTLLMVSLFLMGAQSAFFGPAKYALLPQTLKREELVGGNGLLEMGTFMAILGGTIAAGVLVSLTTSALILSVVVISIAVLGLLSSLAMPKAPSALPELKLDWNPLRSSWSSVRIARQSKSVWLSVLGISWFWFYGALFLSQIPALGHTVLGGDENVVTLLLAMFSIGVALGSLVCERLSNGRVEIGLVPLGSIGLSVFAMDLFFALQGVTGSAQSLSSLLGTAGGWRVLADLTLIGAFGGVYIVPLYALVQSRTNPGEQSRVIAANNILNSVFMVVAAGLAAALLAAGVSVLWLIAVCAVLNAAVALYIYTLVPEFLWRFLAWGLAHSAYRLSVAGKDKLPEDGPALLCPNHVSYVDALLISALTPRPVRFVMDHAIFRNPIMGWLFRAMKAIPIASGKDDPLVLEAANRDIDKALSEGEIVCIFPEGKLTRTGRLNEFRQGASLIAARNNVSIYPIGLSGLWGSALSLDGRSPAAKLLRWRGSRAVTVRVGSPVSAATPVQELRELVYALHTPPAGLRDEPLGPERRKKLK